MEILKTILYVVATFVMAGILVFCPEISDDVCIFYVSILTTYLGLDVWSMIKTTSLMPPGKYKDMKMWRYALCASSYVILIGIAYAQSIRLEIDLTSFYSVMTSAIFILIGLLIGGLEGNKIATKIPEEKTE